MATTKGLLEKLFKLEQHNTTVKRELLAGVTTFMTMAYVIFVCPNMLADVGMPKEAAFGATIFATVFSTALMGLWANFPVGVAPGMGLGAFFAYYVCGALGLHWTVALGATFISGIVFLLLTITHLRQLLIDAVPLNLKYAIVVGIGLFITFIGLRTAGIVVNNDATLVALGKLAAPSAALACFGLIASGVLIARGVQGALLYGILLTTLLAMAFGAAPMPQGINDIITFSIPDISPILFKLDIMGAINYGILSIIFTFTIVELFDNMGTLIGLSRKANFMDKDGHIKGINKALFVDSVGVVVCSGIGTSSVSSYIESATGIAAGGRTGLTAMTIAGLFLITLFFAPFIGLIPAFATAPALIIVGIYMISEVRNIDFDDFTEAMPAFLTIVMMPLTYNIAHGIGFGFISYALLKLFTGQWRKVNILVWVFSVCFLVNFIISPH